VSTIITYKIVSDSEGKLRDAAKLACSFWNRYVVPSSSIVIRLDIFTAFGNTIARAYEPYKNEDVMYGRVEFNTKYLATYLEAEIVGTIIHEIGHTLGFGWDRWMALFDRETGEFKQEYIDRLPALADMRVETDYGPGTRFSHWDEEDFDKELMTGFKDKAEFVLPVTIGVTRLLGHEVNEELLERRLLADILDELRGIQFTRVEEAERLDREYLEETDIWEEVYTVRRIPRKEMGL
jgi:hypothetical protein